jgi:F-type H+-transporting ATPase subunit a
LETFRYFSILFLILIFFASSDAVSQEENLSISHPTDSLGTEKTEFDASEFIMDHIKDSHEWHILTKSNGESVAIYLPVILFSKERGLVAFSSKRLAHGEVYNGFRIEETGDLKGKIVAVDDEGKIDEANLPLDLSFTKTATGMLFAALIGLWVFITLARSYKKTGMSHPKGIQGFLEPVILFVRDDIAADIIGEHKYERYMPYLLSVFFFILINNLMGMVPFPPPFGANVTGNIAVTGVLAVFSFVIIQISGNKNYWRHIFATPGVPFWLLPIMIVVELIGVVAKPFALMIRLFANITAGHIIILSLVSLIFIFGSLAVSPVSIVFVVFMDTIELLVAFLQAYIFTLLSALFISLAVQEEHN